MLRVPVELKPVSVIVLNFNGENIIRKCLDHLLKQTYPTFEIIVVDNASSDGSLAALEEYLSTGKVSVVVSTRNLGVPGGRNLGLLYATADVIAFIDNDAYADKNWLKEAVQTLESDERIGAIASMVFFSRRKIILNGAGGTLNLQGYGGDLCFNAPYEFAKIPHEVLYPMGCGMVVRKSVMDKIGPLDAALFNYYDDTELGIRIWKSGFRIVVSPYAWVDHDFSYSDRLLKNKLYLCERNRIRTVLKYYPATALLSWILHEWYFLRYLRAPSLRSLPFKAWSWNLLRLASALKWRAKFFSRRNSFWRLLNRSWGSFPPPIPNNQAYRPDPMKTSSHLILDGDGDSHQLNFGWYHAERDGPIPYRWTDAHASALFYFVSPVRSLWIRFRPALAAQRIKFLLRPLGGIDPAVEIPIEPAAPSWQDKCYSCNAGPGIFELLLSAEKPWTDPSGRTLGIAVSSIRFD